METAPCRGRRPEDPYEPGGLAVANGRLIRRDTNNHRILSGDPMTGGLEEIRLSGE